MSDIHPNDIDPETGRPYPGYSSPALDTSFHDGEMNVGDDPRPLTRATVFGRRRVAPGAPVRQAITIEAAGWKLDGRWIVFLDAQNRAIGRAIAPGLAEGDELAVGSVTITVAE
jgi:hypothetical protein